MRVGLLHVRYLQQGGEDRVVAAQKQLLVDRGHEVLPYDASNADVTQPGTLVSALARGRTRGLRDQLARDRPDVLHVHNTHLAIGPGVYRITESLDIPTVTTLHNYRWFCVAATLFRAGSLCTECLDTRSRGPGIRHGCFRGSRVASALVARDAQRAVASVQRANHHVIALTNFQKHVLAQQGIPDERIHVLANFVPDVAQSGRLPVAPQALYVGRLSAEKGIAALAEAWQTARPATPLLIAGDGPDLERLKTIERRGDRVRVLGRPDDAELRQLRAQSAVQVVPSRWFEGFPLVVAEALAAGTPLVVPNLGPLPDAIGNGTAGIVVPAGDDAAMVTAANELAHDAGKRARFSAGARQLYEARHTPAAHAAALERLYARMLEEAQ